MSEVRAEKGSMQSAAGSESVYGLPAEQDSQPTPQKAALSESSQQDEEIVLYAAPRDLTGSDQAPEAEAFPEDAAMGNAYSSVNLSGEFGFESRQNIDSFLGEYENPMVPLSSEQSYKGSRSENREIRDEAQWWR